jgi:hypothetical protein
MSFFSLHLDFLHIWARCLSPNVLHDANHMTDGFAKESVTRSCDFVT